MVCLLCAPLAGRASGLWLTFLAASSASEAVVQYVSGASSLPPRYPLKAKWYKTVSCHVILLTPSHDRRVALRDACIFVLRITEHHGAKALVPPGQTQGLRKRFMEIGRRGQITSPAGPQPFRVGIKLQIGQGNHTVGLGKG